MPTTTITHPAFVDAFCNAYEAAALPVMVAIVGVACLAYQAWKAVRGLRGEG